MSARIAEATALSLSSFCKRYRSSYETPSPSSSPTLPIRKRYQGTSERVEDTEDESSDSDTKREGSEDEGPGSEEEKEEAAPEGQQALRCRELALGEGSMPSKFEIGQSSRSVLEKQRIEETPAPRPSVHATWVDPVDDILYTDILIYVPPIHVPVQTPPSPEWSSSSLPVSPSSLAVPTPVASPADSSPVASPATVEAESFLAELGAQVELQGGLIHDHIQRLDTLPTALFEGYNQDFRELYARSRTVREEIFSQRCRLMSLEQEHERAIVTFGAIWRLVLALES
ncbi:hypothetical protein Tco_0834275 [Tanacetum coccineum]